MNRFALVIGGFGYLIFFLGIFGLLYLPFLSLSVVLLFISLFFVIKQPLIRIFSHVKTISNYWKKEWIMGIMLFLFVVQVCINFIGALGPEIGFDALWYHLTLPKIYLLHHQIIHIPGGLLYYSDMPKLMELFYLPALAFGNETIAKLIHFSFGILTAVVLYQLAKTMVKAKFAFLAVLIFYTNLVVGWESTSAYIDLGRAFFEILALFNFLTWQRTQNLRPFLLSAIFVGLAITTKVLALGSLLIFILLFLRESFESASRLRSKNSYLLIFIKILLYFFVALLIPLPWFIFSYIHTGNPVYPFFTHIYSVPVSSSLFNPLYFFQSMVSLFLFSPDPISPIYFILLPVIIILFPNFSSQIKIIALYSLLGLFIWYVTPQTGGGRFIVPYLPAFSLLCALVIEKFSIEYKRQHSYYLSAITIVFIVSLISIGYRLAANEKYIPVIIGKESKETFLENHLNYHFGDFVDTDGYFENHIKSTDTVLLYGFHNLYYVDFPFVDSSWATQRDRFDYVAVQNSKLPQEFHNAQLIYTNQQTLVQLYRLKKP